MYDALARLVLELVLLSRLPDRSREAEERALYKLIRKGNDDLAKARWGDGEGGT